MSKKTISIKEYVDMLQSYKRLIDEHLRLRKAVKEIVPDDIRIDLEKRCGVEEGFEW